MSVLIKDMEMPKERAWVDVRIFRDGTAIVTEERARRTNHQAIELQPHGRLIDAYELAIEILKLQKYRFSIEDPEIFVSRRAVMQAISDNPPVIEAEEVTK